MVQFWTLSTVVMAACLSLGGCIKGSSAEIASRDDVSLANTSQNDVAYSYGSIRKASGENKRLRAELERRNAFTPEEWSRIDTGHIRVGDSLDLLYASWGQPFKYSSLQSEFGESNLFIYDNSRVYLRNGRVTAIAQ